MINFVATKLISSPQLRDRGGELSHQLRYFYGLVPGDYRHREAESVMWRPLWRGQKGIAKEVAQGALVCLAAAYHVLPAGLTPGDMNIADDSRLTIPREERDLFRRLNLLSLWEYFRQLELGRGPGKKPFDRMLRELGLPVFQSLTAREQLEQVRLMHARGRSKDVPTLFELSVEAQRQTVHVVMEEEGKNALTVAGCRRKSVALMELVGIHSLEPLLGGYHRELYFQLTRQFSRIGRVDDTKISDQDALHYLLFYLGFSKVDPLVARIEDLFEKFGKPAAPSGGASPATSPTLNPPSPSPAPASSPPSLSPPLRMGMRHALRLFVSDDEDGDEAGASSLLGFEGRRREHALQMLKSFPDGREVWMARIERFARSAQLELTEAFDQIDVVWRSLSNVRGRHVLLFLMDTGSERVNIRALQDRYPNLPPVFIAIARGLFLVRNGSLALSRFDTISRRVDEMNDEKLTQEWRAEMARFAIIQYQHVRTLDPQSSRRERYLANFYTCAQRLIDGELPPREFINQVKIGIS